MNYVIHAPAASWKTSVQLPASKSICNRALILNALSYSPYEIQNLSDCDDTDVMVKALNSNDSHFDVKAGYHFSLQMQRGWRMDDYRDRADEKPSYPYFGGCFECSGGQD